MAEADVTTIRRAYAAFARGNIPGLLAVLAADVAWYHPDELPYGGRFRGPAEVVQLFGQVARTFDELRVEVTDVLAARYRPGVADRLRACPGARSVGRCRFRPCLDCPWREGHRLPRVHRFREVVGALFPLGHYLASRNPPGHLTTKGRLQGQDGQVGTSHLAQPASKSSPRISKPKPPQCRRGRCSGPGRYSTRRTLRVDESTSGKASCAN